MKIPERIAALRRSAGLSQEALAEQLGVSRQAIGKWESGTSLPSVENLQALAQALHVSCDELLTDGPPSPEINAPESAMSAAGVAALLDAERAAREQSGERHRRAVLTLAGALACVCAILAVCGVFYSNRLRALSSQLDTVLGRVSGIESGIDARIGAVQHAIEDSLDAQNRIAASFDWQYGSMDKEGNVPLSLVAVPKVFRDGMTAVFTAAPAMGAPLVFEAEERSGVFYAQASIPLEERFESFALSVGFTCDGETQTQELMREYSFVSSRRTVVSLETRDFIAEASYALDGAAVLSIEGAAALTVSRGVQYDSPVPVSAVVELLLDGQAAAQETLDVQNAFAVENWSGDAANGQAAASSQVTFFPNFAKTSFPLPRRDAVLLATVTDSSGAVLTARLTVWENRN